MARYKISKILWSDSVLVNSFVIVLVMMILGSLSSNFDKGIFLSLSMVVFVLLFYENYKKMCVSEKSNDIVIEKNILSPAVCAFIPALYLPLVIINHYFPLSTNVNIIVLVNVSLPLVTIPMFFAYALLCNQKKRECA
ncbi:MAG: hypothetical protein HQK52_19740 [Oligoflexia bacterium]|nr:hypothetical protein [Oligoflexia bacterium]